MCLTRRLTAAAKAEGGSHECHWADAPAGNTVLLGFVERQGARVGAESVSAVDGARQQDLARCLPHCRTPPREHPQRLAAPQVFGRDAGDTIPRDPASPAQKKALRRR